MLLIDWLNSWKSFFAESHMKPNRIKKVHEMATRRGANAFFLKLMRGNKDRDINKIENMYNDHPVVNLPQRS
jgi:hypothetical protein